MPDSQSKDPGFETPFATVSKIGHFCSLHWCPSWLNCINVSDLARNCCLARMIPGEAELVSEWTGLPGRAKSVQSFERSNGLDTALYKKYLFYVYLYFSNWYAITWSHGGDAQNIHFVEHLNLCFPWSVNCRVKEQWCQLTTWGTKNGTRKPILGDQVCPLCDQRVTP